VAGASIGAINAALLISWKDSPDELKRFWKELTAKTWADILLNNIFL